MHAFTLFVVIFGFILTTAVNDVSAAPVRERRLDELRQHNQIAKKIALQTRDVKIKRTGSIGEIIGMVSPPSNPPPPPDGNVSTDGAGKNKNASTNGQKKPTTQGTPEEDEDKAGLLPPEAAALAEGLKGGKLPLLGEDGLPLARLTGSLPLPDGVNGLTGNLPLPGGVNGLTSNLPLPGGVNGLTNNLPLPGGVNSLTGKLPLISQ
jgi:hypothetical protein